MGKEIAIQLAERYTSAIEKGIIKRDILVNHGDDFTGSGEQIVLRKFRKYLSSASFLIAELIGKGADKYEHTR